MHFSIERNSTIGHFHLDLLSRWENNQVFGVCSLSLGEKMYLWRKNKDRKKKDIVKVVTKTKTKINKVS
jgi:hypothetical protein